MLQHAEFLEKIIEENAKLVVFINDLLIKQDEFEKEILECQNQIQLLSKTFQGIISSYSWKTRYYSCHLDGFST